MRNGAWFPAHVPEPSTHNDDPAGRLTPREIEVLRAITSGYSNAQMVDHLGITLRTVETHRKNINQKLGTTKMSALVHVAQRLGLV